MLRILFAILLFSVQGSAQHLAMPFTEAEKKGLTQSHMDSLYLSAVHVDSAKAVFKTTDSQEAVLKAYVKLMEDFGRYLSANNFKWKKPIRCFNKVYFNADGSIDYFLYDFTTKNINPEDQLNGEQQAEFNSLLNRFIQNYKIPVTAKTGFAQCSPATYLPKEQKPK